MIAVKDGQSCGANGSRTKGSMADSRGLIPSSWRRRTRVALAAFVLVAGVCPCAAGSAPKRASRSVAPQLDPGGFSIDFRKAVAQETPTAPEELLQNGGMEEADSREAPAVWLTDSYVWLPTPDPQQEAQMHERIKPLIQGGLSRDVHHSGTRSLHIALPPKAYVETDPAGHEFCGIFHQIVVLPKLAAPTKYVLSYHHRALCAAGVPNTRPYVRITFYDNEELTKAKQTRVYAQNILLATLRWKRGELQAVAPADTRCLDVRLATTGVSEVWYDDVSLRKVLVQDAGPTVRVMPGGYLDELYCLSQGDPGPVIFGFRNEAGVPITAPHLVLQLPEGVEIFDLDAAARVVETKPVEREGSRVREHRIDVSAWRNRIHDGSFAYPYNQWDGLPMLLRTSLPIGRARHRAWYWLEDGVYRSTPQTFDIEIVPPIPEVEGPKLFKSGAHLFQVYGLRSEAAIKAFAALYRKVGFSAVHVAPSPLGQELGRLGVERYTQPFANGYTIGDGEPGKKPAEAVFRQVDGQPLWEAICPVEVYKRGAYFRSRIENDMLRGLLVMNRQAEQIMANWEPYMYAGKGCFCDRCKEEFVSYSKLPEATVERVWPKSVVSEYRKLWTKFRSWQHGRLMVTLEETINRLGKEAGLDSHFIPEIHHGLVTRYWERMAYEQETAAIEYVGELPAIEPWWPYTWFIFGWGPYDYVRGLHLSCHASAQEVREFLREKLPPDKQPRLFAFPYGTFEGATQPEAIAFEFLTYLLNGYSGAFAYLFPGGYDSRYWRAIAKVNEQIAQVERFVCKGRPMSRHRAHAETPLPAPDPRWLDAVREAVDVERWKRSPLLLSWEFEQGDARLIAVGNFWEESECFFRLNLEGLDPKTPYVLYDLSNPRHCYVANDGRVPRRADELKAGVLLHAGALRYTFLIVEPYRKGQEYGTPVRPQDMEAALRRKRPSIERARRG